jgi:hypothetical protein
MGDDADDGWRFGLDDVGPDATEADGRDEDGNVLGSTDDALDDPEPGSPTVENTLFVVLGVASMIGVIALLLI